VARRLKVGLAFDDSLDRPDGVQQQLKLLGSWLASNGCEVVYLAGETKAKQIKGQKVYSLSRNFSIHANQNKLSLPRPVSLARVEAIFESEKFDAVHITLPFSPFLGRQIVRTALKRNIPLIGTFHTFPASRLQAWGSRLYGLWLKRYLKRFSSLTSVSEPTGQYARRCFGVNTVVIPNFIDLKRFQSGRSSAKIKRGLDTVIYLTRLVERKGPHHLLAAVGNLEAQGRFTGRQLLLCGKGEMDARLRAATIRLKLTGKVLMPGFIDETNKADYLASADLAVYPATGGEAFGIVLLEAMAAGALVLGGNNPGYQAVLGGQPELLVDTTNHKLFAEKIDRLLSDNKLRKQMLAWQNQHVEQYDISQVGPQILKLYQQKP